MGIIQRQSIKNSIINYIGVGIGFLSTLFIYNLDREVYGFAQFVYSTAVFLVPFVSLGTISLIVKYFPILKQTETGYKFMNTIIMLMVLASLGFCFIVVVFNRQFIQFIQWIKMDPSRILEEYIWFVFPLVFLICIINLLIKHASNLMRIVVPAIINNLGFKLALPVFILLSYYNYIDKNQLALCLIGFFFFVMVALLFYLYTLGSLGKGILNVSKITNQTKKEMGTFAMYSSLNGLSASFAFRIDIIMISTLLGFASNGTYVILLFFSNIINIPRNALSKISAPLISKAWKENNKAQVQLIYKKASLNLLIAGLFVLILIWFSLVEFDDIASGDEVFWNARYVFLFLGIGRIIDLMMSVNTEIITYSKEFRYNLLFMIVLGLSNVILNYFLINSYGIEGAAIATCLSYVIFNGMKFIFIWHQFGMNPLQWKSLLLILLAILIFGITSFIPFSFHPFINLILKGIVISIIFFTPIYFFKLSPDLNMLIHESIAQIKQGKMPF